MLKKTLLAVATSVACVLSSPVVFAQDHHEHDHAHHGHVHQEKDVGEYKMINGLRYYKTMSEAVPSKELMRIDIGAEPENVGGPKQDPKHTTGGLPMAFRPTVNKDEVWILDSINGGLKLFKSGKLLKNINIKEFCTVQDFAFSPDGSKIAFLNANTGKIYITDDKGKLKTTISGYSYALSIEFENDKELLVLSPLSKGVAKVSVGGAPLGVFEGDQSLSNFSSEKGLWGIDYSNPTNAKLFVQKGSSPKVIAEFPFAEYKDVEYKVGKIYGLDSEGNVYFGLTACDPNGIIYRDRIYKCNQYGEILKELDVIDDPILSPELPRHRIVCPDGDIMTFYSNELVYAIRIYSMK
ncbi:MAG: hypothetical protein II961_07490 [Candidatus Riflebacteria bacterium]|nr:hypothetical protein [Candidatus Riflebacteria bacterium]